MRIRFPDSIELRFVAATTIILALAIATVTLLHVRDTRSEARATAAAHLAADARVLRANVVGEIHEYAQDIRVLANTPAIAAIQRALAHDGLDPESGDTLLAWRERLSEHFVAMLTGKSPYAEVRYLDSSGIELVRVERRAGRIEVITGTGALDAADREYFSTLRTMRPGDVNVVPIQLHAHRDETAQTPIVTFATPVNTADGGFAGAIITDIYGRDVLASFAAAGEGMSYLVDHTGQYIFHPTQPSLLPTSNGARLSLDDDFGPDVAERFAAGSGTFTASGRLFAQVPVEIPGVVTANRWWVLKEIALADLPVPSLVRPLSAAALLMVVGATVSYIMARGVSRSLRSSEERYQTSVAALAEGLVIYDARTRIVELNAEAARLLGSPRPELIGRAATARGIGVTWLTADGEPAEYAALPSVRAFQTGRAQRDQTVGIRRPDGSVVYARANAAPLPIEDSGEPAGVVVCYSDITQQLAAERSLRESEERYRTLTEISPSGIIVTSAESRVTFANPAACEMFGYSQGEFVGLDVFLLAPPDDRHKLDEARRARRGGDTSLRRYEGRWLRKDGSTIHVEIVTTPRIENGEVMGAFAQIRDITDEEQLKEQLLVSQKSEALGTLVAGVAHDFNNILTAIAGGISLARTEQPDSRWLDAAGESTDRAAKLVRQLLQFARHEAPDRAPLSLIDAVEECVAMIRETFDRRITIAVEADESLPLVDGDASQLQQVLMNLLVNARDAVLERAEQEAEGSDYRPRIELRLKAETVDASDGGEPRQQVVVSVTDNGVGIEDEVRDRIFDPFFTTKTVGEGTGLGLSTAYGIVAEHGGSLTVQSEAGKGTTFTFALLASAEDATDIADDKDLPPPPAERAKGSVLLVDDEPIILEIVEAALASHGYDVVAVSSGQDALHAMAGRRFDLAVLDVSMPAPDGWEVLAQMRQSSPETRVLMASGYAVEREVRERGASGFLEKPYRLDTLLRTVDGIIGEDAGSAT